MELELVGPHLRVDARPAQLVAQLRGSDGGAVVTARPVGGATRTENVPAGARQVTFQVSEQLTVEATRSADFVALTGDGGRGLVVAFTGEVTVLPSGEAGDRFALSAHEALLLAAGASEPKVVPVGSLSEEEQAEVGLVVEAATALLLAPEGSSGPSERETEGPSGPSERETGGPSVPAEKAPEAAPALAPVEKPAPVSPEADPDHRTPATKKPVPVPARASGAKKGKKAKGRPQPAKKAAPPLVPAAAATAAAARTDRPVKKAAPAEKKPT
ncbi:MAG: hypothetical protein KY439_01810, partial [Actinobacteria bacterium]|nr:hypothetical protein [Actinomycetota bacterium]